MTDENTKSLSEKKPDVRQIDQVLNNKSNSDLIPLLY